MRLLFGIFICILSGFLCSGFPNADTTIITSIGMMHDKNGQPVHVHGLGIFVDNSTNLFYLVGTTKKNMSGALSEGINLYSTPNLANGSYTFEAEILNQDMIKVQGHKPPFRIERPKIIYCRKTKKYVLWFHLDTNGFDLQMVGVAQSDHITGPYQWIHGFQPDGIKSYDMTLFQDWDGSGYLIRSASNQYAGISKLSDDFLNTTGIISKGPKMEGNTMWRTQDGTYWMLGSHLTGWSPNAAILVHTTSHTLNGATWTNLGNPSGSSTTYDSQSTFVLPYMHPSGKMLYIYMGDRWSNPKPAANAIYVWLPLQRDSKGAFTMPLENSWKIGNY